MKANSACEKLLKRFQFLSAFAMMLAWLLLPARATGQVSFVQVNSSETAAVFRNSVAVPFTTMTQTAGNLNVVVVGWPDTSSTIASVTDSNGNPYALAATTESTAVPAPGGSQLGVSQAIYYAKNIAAGANTVTVTFNQNTAVQSVRIVEYTGLDTANPLDTSVGNSGNALTADSGAITTNSANDLLLGAGTITTAFTGSGSGFNTVLINGLGDIVEDQVVTGVGTYDATATLGLGRWVMQIVAFRAAGQTPPTFAAPTISSPSPASGPEAGGIALTLTGTNFEPGAAVLFSNGGATAGGVNCSVASTTTINCLTPSFPIGAASITVTNVDGQTSSAAAFLFTASTPFATAASPSMTPDTGSTNGGTVVSISGSDFAAGATVTVGGVPADRVSLQNINTLRASLPAGSAGLGAVVVTNPSGTTGTLPGGYTYAPGAPINFVQVSSAQPASPATTAIVTYPLAQTAGNLNVVIIGWADATATVQSVTDSNGNTYILAFPPTIGTGLSQAIYYAKNIVAPASNTVTVTFSPAAQAPDVRILEYSGLDLVSPLDDTNGQSGTGTLLDSGTVFTSVSGDLVIGASMAGGKVVSASPTYTTVTTTPGGSISVEHLVGPAAGRLGATAVQDSNLASWVMQAVAFRQAGTVLDFGISATPPSATVVAGNPATYTVSVSAINGFSSPVTLTCSGLPLGTSCAFAPPTVTLGATAVNSVLTIATTAATPVATSTVTVTGAFGSLTHDTTVSLTVTPVPDFTIAATALSPASVVAGNPSTSTVTIAATNGFTGTVNLSCGSIIPVGTGSPTCTFVPASITGGSGTSTLTVNTSVTTSPVAYTVTVTGTSASLNHSAAPLTLTVTAPPAGDFTIAATALSPTTVAAGASSTSTITIAPVNSFTNAVALTCSVAPALTRGPTCSLNPASVANGSGTSTLTVSTTAATSASLALQSRGLFYAMLLPIGGLALLGTGFTSRKKKLCGFLLGFLMFSGLVFMMACGGSSSSGGGGGHPGTPAGTYTITVTGTSGSLTHTAPVSLIVQ